MSNYHNPFFGIHWKFGFRRRDDKDQPAVPTNTNENGIDYLVSADSFQEIALLLAPTLSLDEVDFLQEHFQVKKEPSEGDSGKGQKSKQQGTSNRVDLRRLLFWVISFPSFVVRIPYSINNEAS